MNTFWKIKFQLMHLLHLLPGYLFNRQIISDSPTHILFCLVDHFEPGHGNVSKKTEKQRMRKLLTRYPEICSEHTDSFGNPPKRTWFFPPHYHRHNNLKELVSLCHAGYGEIELHLHHGKKKPDTSDNLKRTIMQCIEEYSEFGIFGTHNGEKKYGFIHGNSALDNSRGGKFCGVNNEIDILIETGCYADFTFPCSCEANPLQVNSIYYAVDNPDKPKSYSTGKLVQAGMNDTKGLMMIQGPLYPYLKNQKISQLRLYGAVIDGIMPVDDKRIDQWVRTGIHVKGHRNWIVVKMHTHGAVDHESVLGGEIQFIFNYLKENYGSGDNKFLHYVTTRELYNIIKAIECGEPLTNPEDYKNYAITPAKYDVSSQIAGASPYLQDLVTRTYA